ncbi:hypothetical protein ACFFOM_04135 [Microlunatus capsulatus]|uniref:Uncharacterized protein n=1 Tax=Microlunatus capsulatus TaxID=99117 RepID=A0ABS4Z4D1_9ACTN|nr:hypothetical protein [Microlunatus capsulatus]MBP2415901.1 hypothetical protein [Microlunatus capsulatus]
MTQHTGPGDHLGGEMRAAAVAGLAQRVAEVYGRADEDLRHAVHDSLMAGLPASVLVEATAAVPGDPGAGDDRRD